jgi:hypothetical protein
MPRPCQHGDVLTKKNNDDLPATDERAKRRHRDPGHWVRTHIKQKKQLLVPFFESSIGEALGTRMAQPEHRSLRLPTRAHRQMPVISQAKGVIAGGEGDGSVLLWRVTAHRARAHRQQLEGTAFCVSAAPYGSVPG